MQRKRVKREDSEFGLNENEEEKVPEGEEEGESTKNHALHPANIREVVEDGVPFSLNHAQVHVPLHADLHEHVLVPLLRAQR